jgi:NAD(P)-dependent dehydrogenase (short-subunit alcohol dehydrogenase family)
MLAPGEIQSAQHGRRAGSDPGRLDILVNHAAHQETLESLDEISDEEWEKTFARALHPLSVISRTP